MNYGWEIEMPTSGTKKHTVGALLGLPVMLRGVLVQNSPVPIRQSGSMGVSFSVGNSQCHL